MRSDEEGTEDLELIHRFLAGDEQAFEVLLEKYYPRVHRVASRILADPAAGEDIAQEVFVRSYQALPRFRGESSVYAWLYRITVNLCVNALHRRRAESRTDPRSPTLELANGAAEFEASQREGAVRSALAGLPPHYRVPVILSAVEGLTYREIADVLGVPLGTVKSRINFGKRLLRERLLPLLGSGP